MCGIAGFIDQHSDVDAQAPRLERMLAAMQHRGPDGAGSFIQAPLAVGMRRLSIIDLAGGQQPIWNEDRTIGVVFNGEIYNYRELRAGLAEHVFTTESDTEVLVHLYEREGLQMFNKLRGMFALAIIDLPRQRLVLARDHFGQKPMYYHASARGFAFASELKALLTLPWVPRDWCPEAFLEFAAWFSRPAPLTHFQHVAKLPAGFFMAVSFADPARALPQRYWQPDLGAEPDLMELDEAAEMLDAALQESVALHLRADVPIGVLLSSGLDSRCLAAYAQPLTAGALTTFSVGFTGGDSELPGAAQTAAEIGSRHFALEVTAEDYAASLATTAWHLDEPVGDPAAFAVWKIATLARDQVKVLLSGEGADELFAGYEGRYRGMLDALHRTARLRSLARLVPDFVANGHGKLARFIERARLSPAEEMIALRREGLPGDVRHPRGLSAPQMRAINLQQKRLAGELCAPQRDRLSELLALDLRWQLAESLLQKADKMSMAASIELRTPFLDTGVAAVAARMHSSLKLPAGGPGKAVLRRCLARRLKEDMSRPKRGFPIPLGAWLRGPLRERCEAALFARDAHLSSLLDPKLLRTAWNDFQAGSFAGAETFHALWLYEVWRGQFDGQSHPFSHPPAV